MGDSERNWLPFLPPDHLGMVQRSDERETSSHVSDQCRHEEVREVCTERNGIRYHQEEHGRRPGDDVVKPSEADEIRDDDQ